MQLNPIDILKVVLACAIFIAITLGWVHLSRQMTVSKAPRQSLVITVRWIYVFAVVYFVFSVWLGVSVNLLLIGMAVMLLLMPLASVKNDRGFPADNPLGLAIILMIFVPVYVMKQFVLGFPDRDKFVLSPPEAFRASTPVTTSEQSGIHHELATVVATLKPIGAIVCNGKRFDATSFDGKMIDVGQVVRVCDYRNRLIGVCETDEPGDAIG